MVSVGATMTGIVLAGLAMNAARNAGLPFAEKAISGYDA
jgi:hypothetical protein